MKRILGGLISVLFILMPAFADTIVLKNGRRITAGDTWEENGKICFIKYGQAISLPLPEILRVEREGPQSGGLAEPSSPVPAGELNGEDRGATAPELDEEYRTLLQEKNDLSKMGREDEKAAHARRVQHFAEKAISHYTRNKDRR